VYFEVNGKKSFASTGGKEFDNAKPVIIFLSGSGLDHTFWGLHSRFFAFRNYSVLCPDYPGHSHSEGPALASIEEMGDWINDVVEAVGADSRYDAHRPGGRRRKRLAVRDGGRNPVCWCHCDKPGPEVDTESQYRRIGLPVNPPR